MTLVFRPVLLPVVSHRPEAGARIFQIDLALQDVRALVLFRQPISAKPEICPHPTTLSRLKSFW